MDFQGMIQRLRPDARYLLKDGGGALYSDVLEWYDERVKPTEEECLAEWDVMLEERAEAQAERDLVSNATTSALADYSILPDWLKTWTANEASGYIHDNVLNGLDSAGVESYVDNLPNTVAGMKTGLKQIGNALVSIRDILEIIAKLLMYIRDLVIRFRNGA